MYLGIHGHKSYRILLYIAVETVTWAEKERSEERGVLFRPLFN